ncbi:RNA polymerase sigma factor [Paenibacillus sp. IHBB 10380]|uniref:RNA polymerase sigma factor n=1 Tax=Paenibacillus sp. IHBB 10380 TaxID=1566358 RepID=UPI0005CFAEB8|nr:sigma-70 family RNA polymerase sigma factor [Paenibacillus sp. IHBB 10380]AJS58420.1 RNA polymerase subunit sigma-24 [Paenibacillus sp. IHBB 10380]
MSNTLQLLVTANFNILSQSIQQKVYYEYYEYVYGLVYCIVKDRSSTEDIIQESFIKIIENKPKFENEVKLRAWLKVVTRNTCMNYLRKNKKHLQNQITLSSDSICLEELSVSPISVEHIVETKMMEDSIIRYINTLKPESKAIIEYRWKYGLSYKEMSVLLNTREEIIKQRLFRIRERIKKLLCTDWEIRDVTRNI